MNSQFFSIRRKVNFGGIGLILIAFLLFASCGTKTSIVSISDESFQGAEYVAIAVSAPYDDLEIRSYVENVFKNALLNIHTNVHRAMDVMPPLGEYNYSDFQQALKKHGIECVLVVGITDFWTTYYTTPGKTVKKSTSVSNTDIQLSSWGGLFGVRTQTTTTSTSKYIPGITLSQSNVKLDARLFIINSADEATPIWRANSTVSGDYFTTNSKLMKDAALIISDRLREDGFLKPGIDISNFGETSKHFRSEVPRKVVLLGGPNYSIILGCLSCDERREESPFNQEGHFGIGSPNTLWDPCGTYASEFSNFSACNPNAEFPPILIDRDGKEIGKLSINTKISTNYHDSKLEKWLIDHICQECLETN